MLRPVQHEYEYLHVSSSFHAFCAFAQVLIVCLLKQKCKGLNGICRKKAEPMAPFQVFCLFKMTKAGPFMGFSEGGLGGTAL
jgi:hypothetical protein